MIKVLSIPTRIEFRKRTFNMAMNQMFGDGLEAEYVLEGFYYPGLRNLSDEELVAEYMNLKYDDEDEDAQDDELYLKALKEWDEREKARNWEQHYVKNTP
jgi:hypothetical protein